MVWQILQQLADQDTWDDIVKDWRGSVSKEAIAEALNLASRLLETNEPLALPEHEEQE